MHGYKCATVGLMCPTPNGQVDRLGCMTTSVQPMGLVCMDLGSWQQVNMCAWLQPRTCVNKFSYVASKSSMVKSKLPYLHDDKSDTHGSLAWLQKRTIWVTFYKYDTIWKEVTM